MRAIQTYIRINESNQFLSISVLQNLKIFNFHVKQGQAPFVDRLKISLFLSANKELEKSLNIKYKLLVNLTSAMTPHTTYNTYLLKTAHEISYNYDLSIKLNCS